MLGDQVPLWEHCHLYCFESSDLGIGDVLWSEMGLVWWLAFLQGYEVARLLRSHGCDEEKIIEGSEGYQLYLYILLFISLLKYVVFSPRILH